MKPKNRGISYIFSVMLMTLVIVSLATAVLLWGMGVVSSSQSAYSAVFQQKIERVKERLVVEDVMFNITEQKIRIYVRNIGAVPIVIDHVYINNQLATVSSSLKLGIGEGGYLEVTPPFTISSGEVYTIKVATQRGKTVTGQWKAT